LELEEKEEIMRIENGKLITLDEDIERIWSQHGWKVVKEEVGLEGELQYWKIYAKMEKKEV
jgi:hypothetical protein